MHADKMARGESEYQGKLLEARQSDWKDEFVLLVLTAPILVIAWGSSSEDPGAAEKIKLFLNSSNSCRAGSRIYGSLSWRVFMV